MTYGNLLKSVRIRFFSVYELSLIHIFASAYFFDLVTLVGLHLHHTTNALFLAFHGVDDRLARLQNARVNANEGQGTHERVGQMCIRDRDRTYTSASNLVCGLMVPGLART